MYNDENLLTKGQLRKNMLAARNLLPVALRDEYSRRIQESFLNSDEYKNAKDVFVYINFGPEVETSAIIENAISSGKNVFAPRVRDNDNMEFIQIASLDDLELSTFGVPEPCENSGKLGLPSANSVFVIPGLVFGRNMRRIGYGKGYYDKYIAKHGISSNRLVAIAYSIQLLGTVPFDDYDCELGKIITDSEIVS